MAIHPTKGFHEPVQVGEHPGLILGMRKGEFRAPESKLLSIASLAKALLCRASVNRRWLPAEALARLTGKAPLLLLYLAIPAKKIYRRELHDVVSTKNT